MPLRSINTRGEDIFSFQLDEESWSALQAENKSSHHLRMQCCDANVVLKKSNLELDFSHTQNVVNVPQPLNLQSTYLQNNILLKPFKRLDGLLCQSSAESHQAVMIGLQMLWLKKIIKKLLLRFSGHHRLMKKLFADKTDIKNLVCEVCGFCGDCSYKLRKIYQLSDCVLIKRIIVLMF